MGRSSKVCSLALVLISLLAVASANAQNRPAFDERADREALTHVPSRSYADLCDAAVANGEKRCLAKVVTDTNGQPLQVDPLARTAFGPTDLQSAYKLPSTGGKGKTIALIDAYYYPNAEADLATYRKMYNLPACTSANGCFTQVDATGNDPSSLAPDPKGCMGWFGETALDLQMASATCPDCNILLVEVSGSRGDFGGAVNEAVMLGAVAVSNSYGGKDSQDDPSYNHDGVLITAASGDKGYGVSSPASFTGVVAVGGTSLMRSASSRGWAEQAWSGSGSGCSAVVSQPPWQTEMGCSRRAVVDVSAVGDPRTGVAVFCSDTQGGNWQIVGGTSAAAPIVAGAFTVLNVKPAPSFIWQNPADFFDVTMGSTSPTGCSTPVLCTAGVGWDGPTGWGSPNGTLLGGGMESASDAGAASDGDAGLASSGDGGMGGANAGGGDGASLDGPAANAGSSSSSSGGGVGPSSSGASSASADAGIVLDDASVGLPDASVNDNNGFSWNPNAPAGCGCTAVGGESRYGGLGALGIVVAWAMRRKRDAQPDAASATKLSAAGSRARSDD